MGRMAQVWISDLSSRVPVDPKHFQGRLVGAGIEQAAVRAGQVRTSSSEAWKSPGEGVLSQQKRTKTNKQNPNRFEG